MQSNTLKINNFTSGQSSFQKKQTRVVGFFEVDEQDQDPEPVCFDFNSQDSCLKDPIAKPLSVEPESRPCPPKDSYLSDLDWNISQVELDSKKGQSIVKREEMHKLKSLASSSCINMNKMVFLRPQACRMTVIEVKEISMADLFGVLTRQKSEGSIRHPQIDNKVTIDFTYSIADEVPRRRRFEGQIRNSNASQG